jgi:NACHT domain
LKTGKISSRARPSARTASRRTGMVVLALLTASVATALLLARAYHLGVAQTLAAALIGGGAPAGLYLAWVSYRDGQNEASQATLAEIADRLAAAIDAQWQQEAAVRRLNDPYPLPVAWVAADTSLADDWETLERVAAGGADWPRSEPRIWAASPAQLAGSGSELADVLTRVPTGRLVVLGEPGTGKSMLMVRLVLDLLARRAPGGPVPVLFSLASWNPEEQQLRDWLSAKISTDHPALAATTFRGAPEESVMEALLGAGLVVPVLDGLDEIPDEVRGPAIAEISYGLQPGWQAVVTSRTEQYRDMMSNNPRPALRAGAIELRPLDAQVISRYLIDVAGGRESAVRWAPVLAALATTSPVAQALATPLMISLARVIYNPRPGENAGSLRDPAELCDTALIDRHAVESLLFDAYIPAAYRSHPSRHRSPPAKNLSQASRWLAFLARHLEYDVKTPDLAWWQLSRSVSRRPAGLVISCVSFLTFGFAGWIAGGNFYGIGYGLTYGVVFGLAGYVSFVFGSPPPLSHVEFHFKGTTLKFVTRFAVGAIVGIVLAVVTGQTADLIGGVAVGCSLGAYGWLSTPALGQTIPSPSAALTQDRLGTLGFTVAFATSVGTLGGGDVAGFTSSTGGFSAEPLGIAAGVAVCATLGMFFGRLQYGRVGAVSYAVAGGVVGLLATAWLVPVGGLGPGLAFGFTFGISIAINTAAPRAWGTYTLCRTFLTLRGDVPWRLTAFLEDAHRRGVLRQVGTVYQFRHLGLQQRLSQRFSADDPTAVSRSYLSRPWA